jgi:hypothetical protein
VILCLPQIDPSHHSKNPAVPQSLQAAVAKYVKLSNLQTSRL